MQISVVTGQQGGVCQLTPHHDEHPRDKKKGELVYLVFTHGGLFEDKAGTLGFCMLSDLWGTLDSL